MLGKGNKQEQIRKNNQERKKWAIRRLSIGVCSVVVGIMFGYETSVQAEETEPMWGSGTQISEVDLAVKDSEDEAIEQNDQLNKKLTNSEQLMSDLDMDSTSKKETVLSDDTVSSMQEKKETDSNETSRLIVDRAVSGLERSSINNEDTNYLVVDKNYYEHPSINIGDILGAKVSEFTPDFSRLKSTYGAELTENMTVLEFWTKFGYAPEDRYFSSNNVIDQQGRQVSASNREANQTTFELPYTVEIHDSRTHVKVPNLFSRLTVGEQPEIWKRVDKTWGSGWNRGSVNNLEVMSNMIGYGWKNTVDDYLLDPKNNNSFVIPTRYNVERDDVWLTLRGGSPDRYGSYLTGARVHLNATSANGKSMVEKNERTNKESDDFYINTTTKVGISEAGFDSLGEGFFGGKSVVGGKIFEKVNEGGRFWGYQFQDLRDRLITNFQNDLNTNLQNYEAAATGINLGVGGQVQLKGLYRLSDLDFATLKDNVITNYDRYLSDEDSRRQEASHIVNVEYYMANGKKPEQLYSPNKSVFQIETTRPYFTNFGDLNIHHKFDRTDTNLSRILNEKLGYDSFGIEDKGISKQGIPVGTNKQNVRVMVTLDGEIKERNLSIDALSTSLLKHEYLNKELKLFYTYAGLDTQGSIDGLLPVEIVTNQGAYAVPIVRTITILGTLLEENHSYKTVEYSAKIIDENEVSLIKDRVIEDDIDKKYQTDTTRKLVDDQTTTVQDIIPPTVNQQGYELISVFKTTYDVDGKIIVKESLTPREYVQEVAVGKLSEGGKIVYDYEYERRLDGVVTVKHRTDEGNVLVEHKIAEDLSTGQTLQKLLMGSSYEVIDDGQILKDSTGLAWRFKDIGQGSDPAKGIIEKPITTIIFEYEKLMGESVKVLYVNEDGKELIPATILFHTPQQIGTNYKTEPKTVIEDANGLVWDYSHVASTSDPTEGQVKSEAQKVIYVYKAKAGGSVTAKFVDELGNDLQPQEIIKPTGSQVGTSYSSRYPETVAKEDFMYQFSHMADGSAPSEGTVSDKAQVITYVYHPIAKVDKEELKGTVIVHYQDEAGNMIKESVTVAKDIVVKIITTKQLPTSSVTTEEVTNNTYDATPYRDLTIVHNDFEYHFVSNDEQLKGLINEGLTEIILTYRPVNKLQTENLKKGFVTVRYITDNGISLINSVSTNPEIVTLIKKISTPDSVMIVEEPTNITYDITSLVRTTIEKDAFIYELIRIEGEQKGFLREGEYIVQLIYQPIAQIEKVPVYGSVVVHYQDQNGKTIKNSQVALENIIVGYKVATKLPNSLSEHFEVSEDVFYDVETMYIDIEGYVKTNESIGETNGRVVEGITEIVYIYQKASEEKGTIEELEQQNPDVLETGLLHEDVEDPMLNISNIHLSGTLPNTGETDFSLIFGSAALTILVGLGLIAKKDDSEELK